MFALQSSASQLLHNGALSRQVLPGKTGHPFLAVKSSVVLSRGPQLFLILRAVQQAVVNLKRKNGWEVSLALKYDKNIRINNLICHKYASNLQVCWWFRSLFSGHSLRVPSHRIWVRSRQWGLTNGPRRSQEVLDDDIGSSMACSELAIPGHGVVEKIPNNHHQS